MSEEEVRKNKRNKKGYKISKCNKYQIYLKFLRTIEEVFEVDGDKNLADDLRRTREFRRSNFVDRCSPCLWSLYGNDVSFVWIKFLATKVVLYHMNDLSSYVKVIGINVPFFPGERNISSPTDFLLCLDILKIIFTTLKPKWTGTDRIITIRIAKECTRASRIY
ncbi:hypothetical protein RIR_jg39440.t1 [Rhizophagus irregularis DAOM 181602=DAOM 197198]|uniref:Uncharacterized protein n=1 Tax=Rhizophagus irregularis (strain DAOM 181602 / DAOM 197198 / MUCL 43194) TaxID=747089 RepID=U9T2H6_RHIID|nr:hypothetical protein RIR_jg39440.t1 [Rhizophagus irregularis DAOM 181602=DAOM 197198]